MSSGKLITGMGAALVDLFADVSEQELQDIGSPKASMSLIEAAQSTALRSQVRVHTHQPGGSAANTVAGIAGLGQAAGFFGKTADDPLGARFAQAFDDLGVAFPATAGDPADAPTGHCLVLVTPDAERTMHTVLGASITTSYADIDADTLAQTGLFFSEGYVWDSPSARDAFLHAAQSIRANGGKVAFSLADGFCVERHHADFVNLLEAHVDILLANKAEAKALFGTDAPGGIAAAAQANGLLAAITMSADGALIIDDTQATHVPAHPVSDVVDLTGAGDQFAAGFLAALHNGASPVDAGRAGVLTASQVIRHFGPRPQSDIRALLAENDLNFA